MRRGPFIALSLLLDAVLINVGIVTAFFVRFGGELPAFNFDAYVSTAPYITLIYLGAGYVYGIYEPERTENPWAVVRTVLAAVTLGAALTAALLFMGGERFITFSRLAILISWPIHNAVLAGWRIVFLRFGGVTWPEQRVLIVGTGRLAVELAQELKSRSRWGYRVVGFLSTDSDHDPEHDPGENTDPPSDSSTSTLPPDIPVLGTTEQAADIAHEHAIHRVIVVSPVALRDLIERMVLAEETGVRVDVVPELYEVFIGTVDSMVADIPLMEITRATVPPWYSSFKRMVDVSGSLLLLTVLAPFLGLASIAILVSMGTPVLFVQERVGKDGRPFNLYKLRTMVRDAETETGPVLATSGDERITPLGRFLRKYRIDELPQLVNILKGEMSFVGPRPERPYFVERFDRQISGYRERFKIKPGVTGLAQVSGGYATTPERKLKYDLIYMYHQNLSMDLQIVLETLRVILTGHGAR